MATLADMRRLLVVAALLAGWAAPAYAGGPSMVIGAAEDSVQQTNVTAAKAKLDLLKLAGFDAIRISEVWSPGDHAPTAIEQQRLDAVTAAAKLDSIKIYLSVLNAGSRTTPLSATDQASFAVFTAAIAKRYPTITEFVVGNEPNNNRFWLPQFALDGSDAAAVAYESLLAKTYDALKAVNPQIDVIGGALSPRGIDRPGTGKDTHSPTVFIADLAAAFKATGRTERIMDAFDLHAYEDNSSLPPSFQHPKTATIALADYGKLTAALSAFDGTAQPGSTLPIVYGEFGVESQIPPAKASLYSGKEPSTTKPVDEATQAQYYAQAMQMTFCQPTVLGLLLFHVQDEKPRAGWQSGEFYVDGTPKTSLAAVRAAAATVHRGIAASCPGMQLTPRVTLAATAGTVRMTCSVDCTYTVTLDGRRANGKATGGVAKTVVTGHGLTPGRHVLKISATAALNAGPPGTASLTFTT
jgi:hypothetical protein